MKKLVATKLLLEIQTTKSRYIPNIVFTSKAVALIREEIFKISQTICGLVSSNFFNWSSGGAFLRNTISKGHPGLLQMGVQLSLFIFYIDGLNKPLMHLSVGFMKPRVLIREISRQSVTWKNKHNSLIAS